MANTRVRLGGAWQPVGVILEPAPPPPPPPPPPGGGASWTEMVALRSFEAADAWYAANTGHEALGLAVSDLTPGSLTSQFDGQVIEGVIGSAIVCGHSNVTYRGCRITGTSQPLFRLNPWHGAQVTGVVVENCTVVGQSTTAQHAMSLHPLTDGPWDANSVTVRRCNVSGSSSGIRAHRGTTAIENWVHNLSQPPGVHRTAMNIVGYGVHFLRNYLTSGGSSHQSMYFDENLPMHDITIEGQVLGWDPSSSVSYGMNLKDGPNTVGAHTIRIVNNYFGPWGGVSNGTLGTGNCYQFGPYSDAAVSWNSNGNVRSGNQWFLTGEPAVNTA